MKFISLLSLVLLLSFAQSYCMDGDGDGKPMQELFKEQTSTEQTKSLPKEESILYKATGADAGFKYGQYTKTPQYKVTKYWKETAPYGRFVRVKTEKLDSAKYPQQTNFKTSEYKWVKTNAAYRKCIADASKKEHTIDTVEHIRDGAGFDTPKIYYKKLQKEFKNLKSWQQSDCSQEPTTFEVSKDMWQLQLVATSNVDPSYIKIQKRSDAGLSISDFEKTNKDKQSQNIIRGLELRGNKQRLETITSLANQNGVRLDQDEISRRLEFYVVMLKYLNTIHDLKDLSPQKCRPHFNNKLVFAPKNKSVATNNEQAKRIKAIMGALYAKLDNEHKANLRSFAKTQIEKVTQEASDIQKRINEDTDEEIKKIQQGYKKLQEENKDCENRKTLAAKIRSSFWS